MSKDRVLGRVLTERQQVHETRRELYDTISDILGRPVVCFFTSFSHPVSIEDSDVRVFEDFVRGVEDKEKGLAIIINSPGGSGLAAERMVNILRSYSGTGEFWAIVPGMAKSAATMICLGASKLIMSKTSELGPIDPQLVMNGERYSAVGIVNSYEKMFNDALVATGNLEPYLQQLAHYDDRDMADIKNQIDLSEAIAVKYLRTGMLTGKDEQEISNAISLFTNPDKTKTHGRPIFIDDAIECGLNCQLEEAGSDLWNAVFELYVRLDAFVDGEYAKCIECGDTSFTVSAPQLR